MDPVRHLDGKHRTSIRLCKRLKLWPRRRIHFTLSFVCRGLCPEPDPDLAIKAVNKPPGTLELRSQATSGKG